MGTNLLPQFAGDIKLMGVASAEAQETGDSYGVVFGMRLYDSFDRTHHLGSQNGDGNPLHPSMGNLADQLL